MSALVDRIAQEGSELYCALEPPGAPETIGRLLARNTARYGDRPILLERDGDGFAPLTWADFCRQVISLSRFLIDSGVQPGDRVAVISRNRAEMLITEFAVMCLGAIHTPIFAGYAADQAAALIEQSRADVLVAEDLSRFGEAGPPERLRLILYFDEAPAAKGRIRFTDALAIHPTHDLDAPEVGAFLKEAGARDPFEPALLMYTSGTSGALKGVLLTHDNILSQQRALSLLREVTPQDRLLCYLPWHHSFGGIFEKYGALYNGAPLAVDDSHGKDFDRLLENWKAVQPTLYFSVPKIYQQLFDHVKTHPEEEEQIFHDGMRFVFTAAAPLPATISAYFASRGIPVMEGWGLTETSPCCTTTDLSERRVLPGMVGYPIPGVRLRLAKDGEILVKGPNVMTGYFDDPEATRRALPGDGWFHTGDLGEFAGKGLRLLTRKDRIFKLLNAEKVIPTKLENWLASRCEYIKHVVVVGGGRDYPAALIFPNYYLIEQRFGQDTERADREVKAAFREAIEGLGRENPVKYERIQAFAVIARELTVDEGELTPSMKVRVRTVQERAEEQIEAIYEPSSDCDCRFLRKVLRIAPDARDCFLGKEQTLDHCHECGHFVFDETTTTGQTS